MKTSSDIITAHMNLLIQILKIIALLALLPIRIAQGIWVYFKGEPVLFDDIEDDQSRQSGEAINASLGEELDYTYPDASRYQIHNGRGFIPEKETEHSDDSPLGKDIQDSLILDHHALFVRHESRQVLVVDYELPSAASWLEYQRDVKHFSIIMVDGSVAHINLNVDDKYIEDLEQESRILLITNADQEKIVHHLMFLLK